MASQQEILIEPGSRDRQFWSDLWRYRDLFLVFAWRDIAVRYKQTVIGILWALVRPVLTMAVFTVIFGRIASLPSEAGVPYSLMVLAGLLPWQFFSTAMSDASNSLVGNAGLIGKVYFPRILIPAAAVAVSLIDLLVSFIVLIILMAWYTVVPTWRFLSIPFFVFLALLVSLGPGLWFAALNMKYRDFRYIVPVLLQFGLFVSPVGFSGEVLPESWRLLYAVNPMVGVIEGFRWAVLGTKASIDWHSLLMAITVTSIMLWVGLRRFRATEREFADVV